MRRKNPEKLEEMKTRFLEVAGENKDFPIGAGNWLRLHPEDRVKTRLRQLDLRPEHAAHAGIRRARRRPAEQRRVTIDAEFGENANGVLYAVGGSGGGLTVYMEDGQLVYEYNMMIIENYQARTEQDPGRQAPDRHRHEDRQSRPARPRW